MTSRSVGVALACAATLTLSGCASEAPLRLADQVTQWDCFVREDVPTARTYGFVPLDNDSSSELVIVSADFVDLIGFTLGTPVVIEATGDTEPYAVGGGAPPGADVPGELATNWESRHDAIGFTVPARSEYILYYPLTPGTGPTSFARLDVTYEARNRTHTLRGTQAAAIADAEPGDCGWADMGPEGQ